MTSLFPKPKAQTPVVIRQAAPAPAPAPAPVAPPPAPAAQQIVEPSAPPPPPRRPSAEVEARAEQQRQEYTVGKRRGRASTILTGGAGVTEEVRSVVRTLGGASRT